MKTAFWLTCRELVNRKHSFIAGIVMIATAVSLCTTIELISRNREAAMAKEINHIGPALRLIPAEKNAIDLARFDLGSDYFNKDYIKKISRELSSLIFMVDTRLVSKIPVEGVVIPVIGINPRKVISPVEGLRRLSGYDIALGKELASKLGKQQGDEIFIANKKFQIAMVLPETTSADDLALFLPINRLQHYLGLTNVVNEIRVFPAPGVKVEAIVSELKDFEPKINIIHSPRNHVTEHKINYSLSQHRHVLYLIMAVVVALCIFIWSYLNSNERKVEMATIIAIGGTGKTVLAVLVCRAVVVGLIGAVVGYIAGMAITVVQDFEVAVNVIWSGKLFFIMCAVASFFSVLGSLPVSFFSTVRNHVMLLQE